MELNIPEKCLVNAKLDENDLFRIRLFKFGQRIFPVGFKAFRISWCQYAVNFPPLTAKYLYERYTEHIKEQDVINIYDPSSGWGGRCLGAMSVTDDRNVHYIGTDPNTDHWIEELGITKYEYLAKFFNENKTENNDTMDTTNEPVKTQTGGYPAKRKKKIGGYPANYTIYQTINSRKGKKKTIANKKK